MATQSANSIKRSIRALRKIIDNKATDEVTRRMAYFAETTLRWAIEDTVDWQRPEDELRDEVRILLQEIAKHD